jgi:hypothetical protein
MRKLEQLNFELPNKKQERGMRKSAGDVAKQAQYTSEFEPASVDQVSKMLEKLRKQAKSVKGEFSDMSKSMTAKMPKEEGKFMQMAKQLPIVGRFASALGRAAGPVGLIMLGIGALSVAIKFFSGGQGLKTVKQAYAELADAADDVVFALSKGKIKENLLAFAGQLKEVIKVSKEHPDEFANNPIVQTITDLQMAGLIKDVALQAGKIALLYGAAKDVEGDVKRGGDSSFEEVMKTVLPDTLASAISGWAESLKGYTDDFGGGVDRFGVWVDKLPTTGAGGGTTNNFDVSKGLIGAVQLVMDRMFGGGNGPTLPGQPPPEERLKDQKDSTSASWIDKIFTGIAIKLGLKGSSLASSTAGTVAGTAAMGGAAVNVWAQQDQNLDTGKSYTDPLGFIHSKYGGLESLLNFEIPSHFGFGDSESSNATTTSTSAGSTNRDSADYRTMSSNVTEVKMNKLHPNPQLSLFPPLSTSRLRHRKSTNLNQPRI